MCREQHLPVMCGKERIPGFRSGGEVGGRARGAWFHAWRGTMISAWASVAYYWISTEPSTLEESLCLVRGMP